MCGIAGIVGFDPRERVDAERLERMRDTLRHRGPDGAGTWTEGPVGLAHRRLAIVDLTGGGQPMTNEDGTVWIVCNGEIYNHLDLRSWLEDRGHVFRSRCDTESIVHLYEEEGERCVERLRGMFAFALWDRGRGRLLLARDRLGIKPLYYARTGRELLFASEIKAILAAGTIRPELEAMVLPEFLASRYVAGESTFFRGIRKLLPGRTLSWSTRGGARQRRYWFLPPAVREAGSLEEEARAVRDRLEEVVRSHLMSDAPLGLFLSGGLDSSGLAALMARQAGGPIRTFSVGFQEPGANELAYARLAAEAVGAEHHEVVVTPERFFEALPRLVWHEDEPIAFASSVPLFFVSRLAREHVKVVLTGEGADELFLGYNRYRVTAWNERLGSAYDRALPEIMKSGVRRAARALPAPLRRYASRSFLALGPGPRSRFFENFAVFPLAMQRRLLARPDLLAARDPYTEGMRRFERAPGGILERMSHADLQTYLVELLMKQDQMSMAASIESRVPFLDHEFVEHVTSLPARYKLRGFRTKAVLRRALRDLVPREVLTRKKMGFPVPVGRWLRSPHAGIVEEFVLGRRALGRGLFEPSALHILFAEHRAGLADHGERLWLLLNLEVWQRVFLDGEPAESVRCLGGPARSVPRRGLAHPAAAEAPPAA